MRGSAIRRDLRQLSMLPLRRETIFHLVFNRQGAEPPSLNRLIAADPALSLAVLRLAPRSLAEGKLGIPQIARFATPTTLLELVRRSSDDSASKKSASSVDLDQLWVHSLATAHAARHLSRIRHYEHSHTAFLAGLLHNIGLLAISTVAPDAMAELLQSGGGRDLFDAEQDRFGTTHTQIGNQLAKRWGLPQWLHEVLWWHHQADSSLPTTLANRALVELVREADVLVSSGEFGLRSTSDSAAWRLPWKNGDAFTAAVSRGVRQATAFMRDHPLRTTSEDPNKLVSRAVELASQNIAIHAEFDWRKRAWDKLSEMPPDVSPGELTEIVAETFAQAVGALGTLCYVRGEDGRSADGSFWCDSVRSIHCSIEVGAGARPHSDQVIAQLRPTWQQRPYQVISLDAGDQNLAHILLWLDEFGPSPSENVLGQVTALCTFWLAHAAHVAQLETQLESLTDGLRDQATRSAAELENAKLSALAEMAGGAGHEINNPLAVISGRAQLLIAEESDPRRRKSLETIVAQAQRIHRMIVDLMLFARPPKPDCKPVSLSDVVERAVGTVKAEVQARKVVLTASLRAELPQISGDLGQLASALECVLRNSIEATPEGGTIEIAGELCGDSRAQIRVKDNGSGITDEQRKHIFEPFFSGRDAGRGLGMGLSKAWSIVQNHGGEILVESGPSGTAVVVRLPALAAANQQRACA